MSLNTKYLAITLLLGAFSSVSSSLEQEKIADQRQIPQRNGPILDNEDTDNDAIQVPVNFEEANQLMRDILSSTSDEESPRSNDKGTNHLDGLSSERLLKLLKESSRDDLEEKIPSNRNFTERLGSSNFTEELLGNASAAAPDLRGYLQDDGTRCIKKVILVDETLYDREMKCHHVLKDKCHTTYITDYTSTPEEKCETLFQKNCHISFKPVPHTETFNKCHTPFEKKCGDGVDGPKVCKTVYEDYCDTRYERYDVDEAVPICELKEEVRCRNETTTEPFLLIPHADASPLKEVCEKWPVKKCRIQRKKVSKVHPKTECRKVPKEICAFSNCIMVPGRQICQEEARTVIQKIPQENCDLEPQKNCRKESTLVPRLIPKKNCIKVPKDVCVNLKSNPRVVKKPILKNWCYDPKEFYNL